jgi:putative membrane protein (TIGR04086 family)
VKTIQFKLLTRGLGIAIIVSFVLTLVLSLLYFLTSLQESLFLSLLCTGTGILVGSAIAARRADSHGIIYGVVIGVTFFFVTLLVHFLLNPGPPSAGTLIPKTVAYILSGILGSILGVFLKK